MSSPVWVVMRTGPDSEMWNDDVKLASFTDANRALAYVNGYSAALDAHDIEGYEVRVEEVE